MRVASIVCFLFLSASLLALTPNIPAGTLVSKDTINTRDGSLHHAVINAPDPVVPDMPRQARLSGRGVYVVEISVASGIVDNVRVLQSTGQRILDDAAIDAFARVAVPAPICLQAYGSNRLRSFRPDKSWLLTGIHGNWSVC